MLDPAETLLHDHSCGTERWDMSAAWQAPAPSCSSAKPETLGPSCFQPRGLKFRGFSSRGRGVTRLHTRSRGRSSLKIKWKRPSAKSPPEEVEPWDCLCLRAVQTGAGVRRAREACGAAPQLTWVTVMVTQSLGCSEAPAGPSRRRRAGEVRITQTTLACLSGDSEVEPGHGHQRNSVLKSHNIETFYCALASPKGLRTPFRRSGAGCPVD
ncbi:uncharacterized protein [Vicugna pacos]|uniref:Uncharacterized protein n=1 Tax=Vicugna pacos TaxID=30538 RepID=A0ABM5CSM1_VICPA